MKIIFPIPEMQFGGSERWVSNISAELTKLGHDVLIVPFAPGSDYDLKCRMESLNLPSASGKINRIITMLKRIRVYKKLVKREKPDVIVSVRKAANRINTICRFKGVRQFVSCRGFKDIIYDPSAFTKAEKNLDGIIFNSRELRDYYIKTYGGSEEKTFYNYNLMNFEAMEKGKNEPITDEPLKNFLSTHRTITCVARLAKLKGQEELIRAFEIVRDRIPDAGLCLVGGQGDNVEAVTNAAKESRYSQDIFLAGDRQNPFNIMSESYVYALPSLAEGFPNALVEALYCELPIVATKCMTGPSEILEDGKYGILAGTIENNEAEFAEKLILILTDTALHDKIKGLSYGRAMDFLPEKSLKDFLEIIGD